MEKPSAEVIKDKPRATPVAQKPRKQRKKREVPVIEIKRGNFLVSF
jgi:hypothetical protein